MQSGINMPTRGDGYKRPAVLGYLIAFLIGVAIGHWVF